MEGLTVVVLAHELAHAYSHLGRDIDGHRWETSAFARTDLGIAEGLAQFYTATICEQMQFRFPAAQAAYAALLTIQKGPYRAHEKWLAMKAHAREVVRFGMVRARLQNILDHEQFEGGLGDIRQGVEQAVGHGPVRQENLFPAQSEETAG